MIAPPQACQVIRADTESFSTYQGYAFRPPSSPTFGMTRQPIKTVPFGQSAYKLRSPKTGVFRPGHGMVGQFHVDEFPSKLVGSGENPSDAFEDWATSFHAEFQRLFVMRPFEMEPADTEVWALFEKLIDVEDYRAQKPMIVLQQGRIVRSRPFPDLVEWEDGSREKVILRRMPDEFVTFKAGQYFEAMVRRHSITRRMLKVEWVKRICTPAKDSDGAKLVWDESRTSAELPDTTWD